MRDDEFIAGRIRWRAAKHRLPADDMHDFAAASDEVRSSVLDACSGLDVGSIVLVFGNSSDRWTALGTRAVVSNHEGTMHHCRLSQIASFHPARTQVSKRDHEYLAITLKDGSIVQLWGPRGSPFFVLWNILLGISQITDLRP